MKKNIYAFFGAISLIFLLLVFLGIWTGWNGFAPVWTGFGEFLPPANIGDGYIPPKSLWDVLSLIITPLFLAIVAFLFSRSEREKELILAEKRAQTNREIEADRMREESLQSYLDRMTELILEKDLHKSGKESELRNIARVRTLTTLDQLNGKRKVILFRFLFESGLLNTQNTIIRLNGANLSDAEFYKLDLRETNLSGANLQRSTLLHIDLPKAYFKNSNLSNAQVGFVDLTGADLSYLVAVNTIFTAVIFSEANLCGAIFKGIDPDAINKKDEEEQSASIAMCNFQGAIYDNKTVWPDGFDPIKNGAILKND